MFLLLELELKKMGERIVWTEKRGMSQVVEREDTQEAPQCYIDFAMKMAEHGQQGNWERMGELLLSILEE